ncbi:hypothetical protein ACQ86K_29650 [Mucilaginibacter sp. P19]|uniref:hypothetical protein n=1 Tax=Mucilaginibacter sp. P19 TaxID=3423947 RepID=UPI003D67D5B5
MMKQGLVFKKEYKRAGLFAGIALLAAGIVGFNDDLFQISKNLDVFASVYKEVNINYVDDINSAKLVKTGVDAMLDGLDPYTEFVPESEIEDYKLHYVSTQYGGIGASIFCVTVKYLYRKCLRASQPKKEMYTPAISS